MKLHERLGAGLVAGPGPAGWPGQRGARPGENSRDDVCRSTSTHPAREALRFSRALRNQEEFLADLKTKDL